jgi:N-succinyldiaminopimelate aminotransferase
MRLVCSLHAPDWTFDEDELRRAFNPKTRAIIINTPHNPTGKVFTLDELTLITELAKEFDVTVISDEVYEHLIYEPAQHIPIASLPDMFERTVTIGSTGKTFGMTGWKLGWLYGHPDLIQGVWQAHQFIVFATSHPTQVAVAHAFNHMDEQYYQSYRMLYSGKRQHIMEGLSQAGLKFAEPMGTYFVMADFSPVFDGNDVEFATYLIQEIGVAAIPPSAFYREQDKHLAKNYARFSFAKHDDQLDEAINRMKRLKS